MKKTWVTSLLVASSLMLFTACGKGNNYTQSVSTESFLSSKSTSLPKVIETSSKEEKKDGAKQVIAKPEVITVLVNKQLALPESYKPKDLVYPNISFIFREQIDKRKMRKEAAAALEDLFIGAKKDNITLLGVSGYRTSNRQKTLFNNYIKRDGEEKARMYSAVPRHSEHETGLAMDVTGGDGSCAAEDCFTDTIEAKWLEEHAAEYGFIIRYLKGKESITGYKYEPWHIRYVGVQLAKEIKNQGITLEEYLNAVPVAK